MALLGNLTGSSQYFNDYRVYNGVATQSLRFDDGSSAYLNRTFSGNVDNDKKMTISVWVKRGIISNATQVIIGNYNQVRFLGELSWRSDDKIVFRPGGNGNGASNSYSVQTTAQFRDVSSWYHIVLAYDTTQSTDTNRVKIYVNGTQRTLEALSGSHSFPPQNYAHLYSYAGANNAIGYYPGGFNSNYLDGYLSEFNFIDGLTLDPTYFGETKNGVWVAKKYTGSYGTNGYRLEFKNTSVGSGSSSTIGADTSGNTNHWTSSGIVASDCNMPDSPENNFATLNPLSFLTDNQLENGNLELDHEATSHRANTGTMFMQTGKWYFEVHNKTSGAGSTIAFGAGLQDITQLLSYASGANNYVYYVNNNNARFLVNESSTTLSTDGTHTVGAGGIIQVAYDADTGKIFIGLNNTYIAEDAGTDGNPATGANPTKTLSTSVDYIPFVGVYNNIAIANFGQDSSFAGNKTAQGNTDANGIGDFYYAPPSGFLALCTANLPEVTIGPNSATQADDYFNTVLYSGSGSAQTINTGFSTDFTWIKSRGTTNSHLLADSTRGSTKVLLSNDTNAEITDSDYTTFVSNGFSVSGNGSEINNSSGTYVSWNWKANGGTTTTNDASSTGVGTIDSVIQANTTAGFSIVTYTGTGSAGTIAHGLGVVPQMFIVKNRDSAESWVVYHHGNTSAPETDGLQLNLSDATVDSAGAWNDTAPTSSVFSVGSGNATNKSSDDLVAYVFADIEGYSKFGSHTGNGSTDGTFVYTGFRPAFVMVKRVDGGNGWNIHDSIRGNFNVNNKTLQPNTNGAEGTGASIDFLSNGLKFRDAGNSQNGSGASYIYMAFAEAPFKYANAR